MSRPCGPFRKLAAGAFAALVLTGSGTPTHTEAAQATTVPAVQFGAIGLALDQSLRVNVVNVPPDLTTPQTCPARLALFDVFGHVTDVADVVIRPNEVASHTFVVPDSPDRIAIHYVGVLYTSLLCRRAGVPTLELIDTATGRASAVMVPAVQRTIVPGGLDLTGGR